MEFSYVAFDTSGKKKKGKLDAGTQKDVVAYLRELKLTPLSIKEARTSFKMPFGASIKNSDIVLFTRQLSSMILTGLTLVESLNILNKQTDKPQMKALIASLVSDISEGKSFSLALQAHKDVFSNVYIALITAAETSGLLDKVLERLADNMERSEDLKKRVKSALFYPAIVIFGVIAVIIIMNVVVIPQLTTLYESLEIELPLTTKIVLESSKIVRTFFPVFIGLGILGFFMFKRLQKTERGVAAIDNFKLKIPVVGPILRTSVLDEISRTLSMLINSGSPILGSLKITQQVAGNYGYQKALESTSVLVEKGIPLSNALDNQNLFPPIFIQMVKVGESTGRIDETLLKVSEYFERDLDVKIKTLTTSIEPILIIFLGATVGFLIFSVITPIYGLVAQF